MKERGLVVEFFRVLIWTVGYVAVFGLFGWIIFGALFGVGLPNLPLAVFGTVMFGGYTFIIRLAVSERLGMATAC